MKFSLLVLTPGKWEGKTIPVSVSPFLIGRDPQCHLRPASGVISKRHVSLIVRGKELFARDEGSTNGTFINNERLQGERKLEDGDRLQVGPLLFGVLSEAPAEVTEEPRVSSLVETGVEDTAATMLLALDSAAPAGQPNAEAVPEGPTEHAIPALPPEAAAAAAKGKAKAPSGDTQSAAKDILEKYRRKKR